MSNPRSPFDPRAEGLFLEFLARRDDGAEPDLESVCREHPELADQLRQLLAAYDAASRLKSRADNVGLSERLKRWFGEGVEPDVSLGGEPKPDSGPQSKLFEKLRAEGPRDTRYKLLGEVARGGMGVVLKIWDEELRRTLAMKVVLGKVDAPSGQTPAVDPVTLGRFLEEAQITGQLDHPGIVPVHELGLDASGRVYFTMKLVKGEDLRAVFEHVKSGHDGWNQVRALNVLLRVCEAMAFAHSKQVVHRDLKPANVMVGKFGEVYVMDWGLARVLGREDKHDVRVRPSNEQTRSVVKTERTESSNAADSPIVTMDGDVVGTPCYMSPEQARGEFDKLGAHSDVYSIGAMLYQLISGQMPFIPNGARVSPHAVLARVVEGPPRPLKELAPRAPPELTAICERAMERDIERRYATTSVLADDLRAYLEHRVVSAYRTGAAAEFLKWSERHPMATASFLMAGGMATLPALAGLLLATGHLWTLEDEVLKIDALCIEGYLTLLPITAIASAALILTTERWVLSAGTPFKKAVCATAAIASAACVATAVSLIQPELSIWSSSGLMALAFAPVHLWILQSKLGLAVGRALATYAVSSVVTAIACALSIGIWILPLLGIAARFQPEPEPVTPITVSPESTPCPLEAASPEPHEH